jgi:ATPase subunit of ABC transporter with duplicated ATPase domains
MGYVEFDRVSFAYAGERTVLRDVSFRLPRGCTALIGENGAGKSTLLRLIAGELAPDAGVVRRSAQLKIAHCDERLEHASTEVLSFADAQDGAAYRLQAELRLDQAIGAPWPTLSPGQRRRMQLGAALHAQPDLLLLDEPSNHIDAEARAFLLAALARFEGDTLLISHDRALVDAVAAHTLQLAQATLRSYQGGYSAVREVLEREQAARRNEKTELTREARRERRILEEARRVQAAAERSRSTRQRMRSAHDNDARGMGRSTVAGWAEARASRTVAVQRKSTERAQAHARALFVDEPLGRRLHAEFVPCPRPHVAQLHAERLGHPGRVLLRDVHLQLRRAARVRIDGPNGAGKTTLLRAFHAGLHDPERVLWLPQELPGGFARAQLDALRELERAQRGRVLNVLAALGVDPEHVLRSQALSAGEIRKLCLAWGLGRGVHALFLDEPTNDLDLPSVERLEAALVDYPGALLVITHDERFAQTALNERWSLEHGRVMITSTD